jgi:hypothetical protein
MEGGFMARKARILAAISMLGWSLLGWAADAPKQNSQVTVFVTDRAGATPRLVAAAEQNAARVFQQAGVDVAWVNCSGSPEVPADVQCGQEITTGDLVVRILARARTLPPGVFGVSFVDNSAGVYADVFFNPIQQLRDVNEEIPLAAILGDVMAHELGHLLLGSNAHSRDGIMQPHWNAEQLHRVALGQMRFTKEQAAKLQNRIASFQKQSPTPPILAAVNR